MYFHPKPVPSLFLASLTLLVTVTSTPLPVDAADAEVSLRQLTPKNFNTSIAHDTWYVSDTEWGGWRGGLSAGDTVFPFILPVYIAYTIHHTSNHFVVRRCNGGC